jgi:hypothetical protein
MTMNGEVEGIGKEAALSHFKVFSHGYLMFYQHDYELRIWNTKHDY